MIQQSAVLPAVLVLIAVWLALAVWDRLRRRRRLRQLVDHWGRAPENRRTDAATARRLHDLMGPSNDPATSMIDGRTWSDLDLDTGRTAIDLLEHVGYPAEVVEEARRLTTELETSG